jgi:hypothetical protein
MKLHFTIRRHGRPLQFARKLDEQRLLSLQNVADRAVIVVCMDRIIVGLNDPPFPNTEDKERSSSPIPAARDEMAATLWTGLRNEAS